MFAQVAKFDLIIALIVSQLLILKQKMATYHKHFGLVLSKSESDLNRIRMASYRKDRLISKIKEIISVVHDPISGDSQHFKHSMDTNKFGQGIIATVKKTQPLDNEADQRQKDKLPGFQAMETDGTASSSTAAQNAPIPLEQIYRDQILWLTHELKKHSPVFYNVSEKSSSEPFPTAANSKRDFAAQTTIDDVQSELANTTRELQAVQLQLNERSEQLQRAEAQLSDRNDELRHIQAQLVERTNQIQQMAVTCESQVVEINKLKEQVESLSHGMDSIGSEKFLQHEEPLSLPNFPKNSSNLLQKSKKMKEMEENVNKLTEMNLQWQKFNQKRDIQIKKYETEIEKLKAQIRNSTDSRGVVTFTEAQQENIDSYCQRIRRDGDRIRGELETALAETQQQLAAAGQQMEESVAEAEQRATVARQRKDEAVERTRELQRQVEELNGQVTSLTQEAEELRGALVVATRRHNHQPPPDQRLMNNLKEKSRRYEQKYLNISKDYQKVLHENTQLLAHLNERISGGNQRMPPGLFETIFNPVSTGEGPSSHQSSRSTDRNPEETRGEPTDPYDDIEVDSPVARSSTRRSLSFDNKTRTK